jgi:hypothetical protein
MTRAAGTRYAFNRGLISRKALQRVDLKRSALAAEIQNNFIPSVLGPMTLRPGLEYLGSTHGNAKAKMLPFIFATDDTALLECTQGALRVWVNDILLTRPAVTSVVSNGTFDTDLTGWTDADEASCTSAWATGGYLSLTGTGAAIAARDQEITAVPTGVEHALRIQVVKGNVTLSVGAAQGGTDYWNNVVLRPGWHSIAFTPTGNFWIRLASSDTFGAWVSSVAIESAGAVVLPAFWAESDLPKLRVDQSGDVVFLAYSSGRQQRIERQGSRSWSRVDYLSDDGPFLPVNTSAATLTASALTGIGTLTASKPLFHAGHLGALYRLASTGQSVTEAITAGDQWSDPIRVTGIEGGRLFGITVAGYTGVHTLTLQRSVGAPGDWTDLESYATGTSTTKNDGLDNQIIYYRIGCKTGNYTSGGSTVGLFYAAGSIQGIGRVTAVVSTTVCYIDILKDFGAVTATSEWWEGQWSDHRGWPSAVCLHDGRLWWAGGDRIEGSVSDAYTSFDDNVEGDSGPINRNIGSGPVDDIAWLLPLTQLLVGTQAAELSARASTLDEPLTPAGFSLKRVSTQGSASAQAVMVDSSGIFVQRNGSRVYELSLDANGYNYVAHELTAVVPEIGAAGITTMAVQRQPDTRIHCVRSDGVVALLVYDRVEEVNGWVTVTTDGVVEDVAVLPADEEDRTYYVVQRTINGNTVRYLERWAKTSEATYPYPTADECDGEDPVMGSGHLLKLADSAVYIAGPTTTIYGLSHLIAATVIAWGNNAYLGSFVVSAEGTMNLGVEATGIVIGLPYSACFKSARLAFAQQETLMQRAKIDHIGLLLLNTHAQGVQYGQDFQHLDELPRMEAGTDIDPTGVHTVYAADSIELNGVWTTDARLCLTAHAPFPCTVAAAVISLVENVK